MRTFPDPRQEFIWGSIRGFIWSTTMEAMMAMTGSVQVTDTYALDALRHGLHRYRTIRVSTSQRVVLIPPIGSFLVDWDSKCVRLHIAASSRRDLDELVSQLTDELTGRPAGFAGIDWAESPSVLAPLGAP